MIAIFKRIMPIGSVPAMAAMVPTWPTRPLVPMPAPIGLFSMPNSVVDSGPKIALTMISGSQITGRLTIFGTCSMLVPIPWLISPATPFSL